MDHLGFPALSGRSQGAAVQGEPADVLYTRHHDAKLTWTLYRNPEKTVVIESDRIIGFIPVSPHIPDDHALLYVDITTTSDTDHREEHTHFRSIQLTRPPAELLKDFAPSGRSCWQLRAAITKDHPQSPLPDVQPTPPLHIILSVASGHHHAEAAFHNLLKPYLTYFGCRDYALHRTTSSSTITELARDVFLPAANVGVAKYIVLLSGDGGIADLINGLLPQGSERSSAYVKPSVTILPLGTGNALAHSTHLTADRTLGMSALLRGYPAPLPTFTVRFSPPAMPLLPASPPSSNKPPDLSPSHTLQPVSETNGAVLTSWALHAALVSDSDTPSARAEGAARFQAAARANLDPPHEYRGRISLRRPRSKTWEPLDAKRHAYVVATLCARLEEKFMVSPASEPLDGKLHMVHVGADEALDGAKLTELMTLGYANGAHVQRPEVLYEQVDGMRIEMGEEDVNDDELDEDKGGRARWRRICVDGKTYVVEKDGIVEVWAPGVDLDSDGALVKGVDIVYLPR